jgi:uncharacterized protein (TIGR03083 family)
MTDVPDWPGEYAATRDRVVALVADVEPELAARTVPACPAWTVHDVVAHVAGLGVALGAGRIPQGDVQAFLDELVDERRGLPLIAVLDEWVAAAAAVQAFLVARGAGGGQLVYDLVAHEHDIRHALGRPGARDTSAVLACVDAVVSILERDLATHGLPAVELTSAGRTWSVGSGVAALAIELEPFELIRALGSRRSERQLRTLPWRGDLDRYLPALAHLPLPAADLVE